MRILKIGDDGIRRYTYDQLSVITEANTSNVTVSKYDYGLDQLVSLDNTGEGRSFFHLDIVRSTASLTDAAGSTRQSIFYDAWGNERDRVGASANKFTFTGHEKDEETGLIYAKARFYDPDVGRFLNQDPLLGVSDNPPSLHRYFYAFANPLRFVDLDGLQPRTAEAMLQLRIDEIHEQTGARKSLIALQLAGDLSAVGSGEQVFGTVNVLSLGGAGGVRNGLQDGDISAQNSFFENVYATGESYLSGNVDFVVPGAAEYRGARAQGAGRGGAFVEGAAGAVAVPEWKELLAEDRTAGQRFDSATGIAFKYLRLYIIGRLAWGATGGASIETEGTTQNQSVPQNVKTQHSPKPSSGPLKNRSGNIEITADKARSYNPKGETIGGRAPSRPSWQEAQADASVGLAGFDFQAEPSYLSGKKVPYGTRNSVRPDYGSESLNLSVDVKNYDVTTPQGRHRLVKDVVRQAVPRAKNLPPDMRQGIIIDMRGQQVSDKLINRMVDRIVVKSDGAIQPENIHVQR